MIMIPHHVELVLKTLNNANYEAFIVGGCVRDYLLGNIPTDYDVTTNALPELVKKIFNQYHVIETGLKHGTVTVIVNHLPIEITTYRIDGVYLDNRRPNSVLFTPSLQEDLKRRDFTINAMAYNQLMGIIDYYGGKEDLNNKLIRCVGDSNQRFQEDALRILRALRFASTLNFNIEKDTRTAIFKNVNLLNNIAIERINNEFFKLILGDNCENILDEFSDVFTFIFNNQLTTDKQVFKMINNAPKKLNIRLAILFLNMNSDSFEYRKKMRKFKYPNKLINSISRLIDNYNLLIKEDDVSLKWLLNKLTYDGLIDLILFKKTITNNHVLYNNLMAKVDKIINNNECYTIKHLVINGSDLINIGYPSNSRIKVILDYCLEIVIENNLLNKKEVLLNLIKKQFPLL